MKRTSIQQDGPPLKKARPADDSEQLSLTTLHVRGLSSSTDSAGLSTLFSELGPIRSAFTVANGLGFVRFAQREDAQEALKHFDGRKVDGSKLSVQWARRRLRDGPERDEPIKPKKSRPAAPAQRPHPPPQAQAAPSAVDDRRKIVVRGLDPALPADATKKALFKKIKKLMATLPTQPDSSAVDTIWPVEGEPPSVAHVIAPEPRIAGQLSARLHNHVFKGRLLFASTKWERDAVTRKGRARGGGRVVVRNLAWETSEDDLWAVFAPFGPIHSVDIPSEGERGKGFGFVWMLRREDAEKAISGVNGKLIRPGVAEERGNELSDNRKKQDKRKDKKEAVRAEGRTVAVDWALGREQYAAQMAADTAAQAPSEPPTADADAQADEDEAEEASEESETEDEEEDDDDLSPIEIDEDQGESDEESADEAPAPKSAIEPNTTLFVRNVQFEATEDELFRTFTAFGPVRYARIVKDRTTGRSRGTGFVSFYRKETADEVLALADSLDTTAAAPAPRNPFAQPSILSADPSSGAAARLSLHGRVLGVSLAVSKEDAESLRQERDQQRKPADRRNIYLLDEGVIAKTSPLAVDMMDADLEARKNSYDARRALLRSNPSLFVSKTRLSVRQIPLNVDDKGLRRVALDALKRFEDEASIGRREQLTAEEKKPDPSAPKPSGKGRIVQSKILRSADRIDAKTGLGRSRGCGFVQCTTHADALRVLRALNGHANAFCDSPAASKNAQLRRPIVEFSLENAQVLQRRAARQPTNGAASKERRPRERKAAAANGKDAPAASAKTAQSRKPSKRRGPPVLASS